ncbi:MAG: transcriptional repressor [Firmicutes bacterium]|jgi:Fur family peroxide stress response transcriptional regulator|nr:transcriptional repressor [Bacillota bacterium]
MRKKEEASSHLRRRSTRQRRVVLEVLRSTKSHPTADWIYEEVRKRVPNVSLGTVYRNLNLLRDMGEIMELNFGSTYSRFDGNPEPHYHFSCMNCGRVLDVNIPVCTELEEKVRREHGWEVRSHRVEFYGLCSECKAEQRKESQEEYVKTAGNKF